MASPKEFDRRLTAIGESVEDNVDRTIRKAALAADQVAVLATPVDKGVARGGWQVSVDSPAEGQSGREDKEGQATLADNSRGIAKFRLGRNRSIHLTNNVDYIEELDKGSSAQAPSGMSALAIMAARRIVKAARILRRA